MCIVLANLSYTQYELNSIEKHILLILCLKADPNTKIFWCGLKLIKEQSGYSSKTVEKTMQSLRDKNKIIYTGNKRGKRKITPEYKVTIYNNPTTGGDSSLITPREVDITPPQGGINNPLTGDIERSKERSIRKEDFLNSSGPRAIKDIFQCLL